MSKKTAQILWFDEISKNDIAYVGGKGANLGEMYRAKIPVPYGFVVTAKAYYDFLEKSSLKRKILTELSGLDIQDSKKLMRASENIKTAILAAEMLKSLQRIISNSYHRLCGEFDQLVAVRSSATAEDLPEASFAGQQETFLNVKGGKSVAKHVQKCWASLFESRAIFYRTEKGFDHMKVGIAVPIQLMVQSEVSGILFTVNPLTNNQNEVAIEAAYGLGQPVVSGELTPDQYVVGKKSNQISYRHVVKQTWQLTLGGRVPVSRSFQEKQKLSDKLIKALAKIGVGVEKHYGGKPQDLEWALQTKKLYVVQTRPVTTLKPVSGLKKGEIGSGRNPPVLLEGLGASPGAASGKVRIIRNPSEIVKVKEGDVLVAEMTNPDYVPAMRRACAILTDKGGRTSHAAIVSRELGIPAVVGSGNATVLLHDGEIISVDGSEGKVYEGNIVEKVDMREEVDALSSEVYKTATKVYLNLAEPYLAEEMARHSVDGVGLLRAEFMIAQIGTHPKKFIKDRKQKEFVSQLVSGLEKFTKAFNPRPIFYRTTDFRTNEYRNLRGGAQFEGQEANPMLGFRGVSRYLEDRDVFELEIEAVKRVRNKMGFKNLHVMLPFVRTVDELRKVKKLMSSCGLQRSGSFKLWIMVEVPSTVILLSDFIKEGIDGVSVGTNDLTMLTLGVDRDNERVAGVYNELDPAILWSLERVITTAKKGKITSSICGQAPSEYPELVEKLVEWGITSVSVSPDVIEKTREIVYQAEKKLIKSSGEKKQKEKGRTKTSKK